MPAEVKKVFVNFPEKSIVRNRETGEPVMREQKDADGNVIAKFYQIRLPRNTQIQGQDLTGYTFLTRYLYDTAPGIKGAAWKPDMSVELRPPFKASQEQGLAPVTVSVDQLKLAMKVVMEEYNQARYERAQVRAQNLRPVAAEQTAERIAEDLDRAEAAPEEVAMTARANPSTMEELGEMTRSAAPSSPAPAIDQPTV